MSEQIFRYVTPYSPGFTIHLAGGSFSAVDGLLELPFEAAAEMDKMIASGKRPDISSNVRKIDEEAANAIVEAHRKNQRPAAQKGVVTHGGTTLRAAQEHNEQRGTNPEIDAKTDQSASPSKTENPQQQVKETPAPELHDGQPDANKMSSVLAGLKK